MQVLGIQFAGFEQVSQTTDKARFRGTYGIDSVACSKMFYDIQTANIGDSIVKKIEVVYFLLTLFWMHSYSTEIALAAKFKLCERTIRNKLWVYGKAIQALKSLKVRRIKEINMNWL